MKLKKFGRAALALAASAVMVLGMTSCTLSFTVGYLFVTGSQYSQIASYRIQNDNGALHLTSTVGSGGNDPIQVVVNASGSYAYVLNYGAGTDANPAPSSISLFSIGGYGALTFQTSFTPTGFNTKNIAISGNYLYALDEFAPGGTGPHGTQSYGDISAFAIDPATGRLTAVANTQQTDPSSKLPLYYFAVGTNPTWMAVNGQFAYVAEQGPPGSTDRNDPPQAIFIYNQSATTGELTLTQSTPYPTGATQLTFVYAAPQYIYALDAGPAGSTGFILPLTNSGGSLSAVTGGKRANNGQGSNPVFPSRMIENAGGKPFLWVSSQGINTSIGASASVLTAYFVDSTGVLTDVNNGKTQITAGTGPRCIVEDPSNQYVYLANFNDSTLTGKKIDQSAGGLDKLPKGLPAPPGSPTWCAVTGSTF